MIDPRLLLLVAVSEYGTLTAAAEALYRSPSGVSKQLKELSADLDITLLERQGRRVRLTPAALRLVEHARIMSAQWELALSESAQAAAEPCGTVSVGAFPTAISAILTPAILTLQEQHPMLRVSVHELYSSAPLRELETGTIDLGLLVDDGTSARRSRFTISELATDPIDLLVHRDHRFAGLSQVDLAEAAEEDWITGRPGQDAFLELIPATRAAGYAPRVAHHAQEFGATTALVAARLGIAVVPRLATLVPHPEVVRVPLTGPQVPSRTILLAGRTGSLQNPRISAVVQALRAQATAVLGGASTASRD